MLVKKPVSAPDQNIRQTPLPIGDCLLVEIIPGDENPFRQHPSLGLIWPSDLAKLAEEAIDEDFEDYQKHGRDYGKIFLIYHQSHLIGITGYLPWDLELARAGLRWHGLREEYRGAGRSTLIMNSIMEMARNQYPWANSFVEFMPVTADFATIKTYFERLGFEALGDPVVVGWSPSLWQEFVCDINAPLIEDDDMIPIMNSIFPHDEPAP